jgi:multidrug transporter EmrE-like cation transporter
MLLGAAIAVAVSLAIVSYLSYALGFDGAGVLVLIESVLVFGAALSYCHASWPKWHEGRLRKRIALTLAILVAVHMAMIAVAIRRLRGEWGAPVWMGIGLGEILCIAVVLEAVMRRVDGIPRDSGGGTGRGDPRSTDETGR